MIEPEPWKLKKKQRLIRQMSKAKNAQQQQQQRLATYRSDRGSTEHIHQLCMANENKNQQNEFECLIGRVQFSRSTNVWFFCLIG